MVPRNIQNFRQSQRTFGRSAGRFYSAGEQVCTAVTPRQGNSWAHLRLYS